MRLSKIKVLIIILGILLPATYTHVSPTIDATTQTFIVQAHDMNAAAAAVRDVGGRITHELGIINAIAAELNSSQRARLESVTLHPNPAVEVMTGMGGPTPESHYPTQIGADILHDQGIDGYGITIAVIDTGVDQHQALQKNAANNNRSIVAYDAILDQVTSPGNDGNGHGTHVTGIMMSRTQAAAGSENFHGVAPNADLVSVKAFSDTGSGTYADVIRGIDWVVQHKDVYGIRILNCSFRAEPRSFYWQDPLNQAVMQAWQAGIVVVAAAGNTGPDPMTIGVPGNVPYVITIGATSDSYTPDDPADDTLASFSAAGPTVEGFVKPELVAPGGHMLAIMPKDGQIAQDYPEFHDGRDFFVMSGTSQATAVVSGAAALLLQTDPSLTPDDVKCRLMATARAAMDASENLAYSALQQGAGWVRADLAVSSSITGCGNHGLDIANDVTGIEHYAGPVRLDEDGRFVIVGTDQSWDGSYSAAGFLWIGANPWIDPTATTNANPWIDPTANPWIDPTANPWIDPTAWTTSNPWHDADLSANENPWLDLNANPWIDPTAWTPVSWSVELTEPATINLWVDQE